MFDHSFISIADSLHPASHPEHYKAIINGLAYGEDAQFGDPTNNNYIQAATAPENDQGDSNITNAFPAIQFDLLGKQRILGNGPDLGPYEVK